MRQLTYSNLDSPSGMYLRKNIFSRNKSATAIKRNGRVIRPIRARIGLMIGVARSIRNKIGRDLNARRIAAIDTMPNRIDGFLKDIYKGKDPVKNTEESFYVNVSQIRKDSLEAAAVGNTSPVYSYLDVYFSSRVAHKSDQLDYFVTLNNTILKADKPEQLSVLNDVLKSGLKQNKITTKQYDKLRTELRKQALDNLKLLMSEGIKIGDFQASKKKIFDLNSYTLLLKLNWPSKCPSIVRKADNECSKMIDKLQKDLTLTVAIISKNSQDPEKVLADICDYLNIILDLVTHKEVALLTKATFQYLCNDLCEQLDKHLKTKKDCYSKDGKAKVIAGLNLLSVRLNNHMKEDTSSYYHYDGQNIQDIVSITADIKKKRQEYAEKEKEKEKEKAKKSPGQAPNAGAPVNIFVNSVPVS